MTQKSSDLTYIGIMVGLYGLMIMGGVFAASAISPASSISPLNELYQVMAASLNGAALLLLLSGVLVLTIGLYAKKAA